MEFRFINNNAPLDRRAQRLVRTHAMKGKNLGRVIPARGRRRQQPKDAILPDRLTTESKCSSFPLNPFSGTELAYFAISVPLTRSVRYLFHEFHHDVSKELYPQVFCRRPKENDTIWFERVIEDPCVFHCAMAVTRAHISHSLDHGGESLESTWHFCQALRLLRRRLGASSKPQDSSIVVAISLTFYANLNGSTSESRVHLLGLKHMLELRPEGLAALCSSSPEVGNKIRRADLELALLAGTPTIFGSQPLPLPGLPDIVTLDARRSFGALPHPLGETSPVIRLAMTNVLLLCSYAGSEQLSAFQYQNLVISILQRLIDFAPLGSERPSHSLDDLCQLGLLAFMSTVLNHTRGRRSACSTLLSGLLRTRLDKFVDETACGRANDYPSLRLWLMFIYSMSAPEYEQCCDADSPVARRIKSLAYVLTLETWEDVAAHLRVYPWVSALHDEPGKKLWAGICR